LSFDINDFNVTCVVGNFMYFAATSVYMVIGSRFLIGVGVSAGAVLFGEIAYTYPVKQRTAAFSVFMSARQIGLIFGPGLNLFLRICNFNIGPFAVNKWTSPALFMIIVWVIIQLMFVFFFFQHSPPVESTEKAATPMSPTKTRPVNPEEGVVDVTGVTDQLITSTHSMFQSRDNQTLYKGRLSTTNEEPVPLNDDDEESNDLLGNLPQNYGSINSPPLPRETDDVTPTPLESGKGLCRMVGWVLGEFVTEQIMLLLGFLFITLFNQMVLETGVVPFAQKFFKWTEFELSLFYSGAGVVLVIGFIIVGVCSKFLSDRWIVGFGLVGVLVSYIWNFALLGSGVFYSWSLAIFIVGSVIGVFALPFVFIPSASMYSKYLPKSIQGFGQGVRRSVGSLASIMGPIWAGASFSLSDVTRYYTFFGVPLLLVLVIIVLYLCSFTKLKEVNKAEVSDKAILQKH
jgi:ceroid-lipofuscinosis MFS transporter 7